jgi:hypothetical protein
MHRYICSVQLLIVATGLPEISIFKLWFDSRDSGGDPGVCIAFSAGDIGGDSSVEDAVSHTSLAACHVCSSYSGRI